MKSKTFRVTLLSDECIPQLVNAFLRDNGVEVIAVKEIGLASEPDEVIFTEAQKRKLPLLTADIRFVGQLYRQESYRYGLILLRYKGRITKQLLLTLMSFLSGEEVKDLKDTVVVVTENRYRITRRDLESRGKKKKVKA